MINFFKSFPIKVGQYLLPSTMVCLAYLSLGGAVKAEDNSPTVATELNLTQETIENSPVLQRWLANPPDLLYDIYNNPSFNTKLRLGLTSRDNSLGVEVGVDDVFIGKTPITVSAGYQKEFSGRESSFDTNLRYYVLPLGSYFNVAPQIGYRQFNIQEHESISGVDVGLQGILVLSPRSADIRLGHTFTSPGSNNEASITTLSASYAITKRLRLGSNIQWRRSPIRYDSRVGFVLEWAL